MEGSGECEGCEVPQGSRMPTLLLLLPVSLSLFWAVFQLLYGSWLLASLITKLVNLFLKDSGIYIGEDIASLCVPCVGNAVANLTLWGVFTSLVLADSNHFTLPESKLLVFCVAIFSAGSLHINLLSRRVVFKHLHYYCRDYSIRLEESVITATYLLTMLSLFYYLCC